MNVKEFVKDVLETITINRIYNFRERKDKVKTFDLIISKNDIKNALAKKRVSDSVYNSIIKNLKDSSSYIIDYKKGGDIIIRVHPFNFKTPISIFELSLLNKISYKKDDKTHLRTKFEVSDTMNFSNN